MRLAVVTDSWDTARGGNECYLRDLIGSAIAAGHSVEVLCRADHESTAGVTPRVVPTAAYPRFFQEWSFERAVTRQIRARSYEAVLAVRPTASVTHYLLPSGLYCAAFEAEREALDSGLKKWLYRPATRLNPKRRLLMRMQEGLLTGRNHPRLMTNSKLVRDQLQRMYGVPDGEVETLYCGVDLDRFFPAFTCREKQWRKALSLSSDELLLLFVAHNFLLKGLGCLLAALVEAARSGVRAHLLVAGNGPVRKFQRLAEHFGVRSRLHFLGSVPREKLIGLYQECDALIHPTFYDPCSLAALEALACGCPVVTTRRNGVAELMESGKQGFILENPRDIWSLVEALRFLREPWQLVQMKNEAARLGRTLDFKTHAGKMMSWLTGISNDE